MTREAPNYWSYLRLPDLLNLQGGLEVDESRLASDEIHFIIVHQVFELWFKLTIHELRLARDELSRPVVPEEKIPYVVHHLRRVNVILGHANAQFDVVETLTPQDFIDFRDKLVPASGFQSFQYRQLEILLGIEDDPSSRYGEDILPLLRRATESASDGAAIWADIERVRGEMSLRQALHEWLGRTPIDGSRPTDPDDIDRVRRFLTAYFEAYRDVQEAALSRYPAPTAGGDPRARLEAMIAHARQFLFAEDVPEADRARTLRTRAALLFIESYRTLPLLAWPRLLIDTIVEVEERLLLWRTRHARMVERVIGQRPGTGGSPGASYLHARAHEHIFTELWEVRSILLPRDRVPRLENAAYYAFETSGHTLVDSPDTMR